MLKFRGINKFNQNSNFKLKNAKIKIKRKVWLNSCIENLNRGID